MQQENWDVEEIVALVVIFIITKPYQIIIALIELSNTLNKRATILSKEHDNTYRNLNGRYLRFIIKELA